MTLTDSEAPKIRLQVFLSRNGVSSRRDAMGIIQRGQVTVNGKVTTEPSTPVDPERDAVKVYGKLVQKKEFLYVLMNKPAGYMTTTDDPHAEHIVFDLLPKTFKHLMPVGRLDKDTEGLLLFTNDGDLAEHLTHPRFSIKKTYLAKIKGSLERDERLRLEGGIYIEGRKTAPAHVKILKLGPRETQCTIEIKEGKKRQIRIMFAKVGHPVVHLKRIAIGPIRADDLERGQWRFLRKEEVKLLKSFEER